MVVVEARLFFKSATPSNPNCFHFQLATGRTPYSGIMGADVVDLVTKGLGPPRPRRIETPGMSWAVWKIGKRCWHKNAEKRRGVNIVLQPLERLANPGMCARRAHYCFEGKVTDLRATAGDEPAPRGPVIRGLLKAFGI